MHEIKYIRIGAAGCKVSVITIVSIFMRLTKLNSKVKLENTSDPFKTNEERKWKDKNTFQ